MSWFPRPPRGPKIFVIGFNKCGTKTLHGFFSQSGIASLHCRFRPMLSKQKRSAALIMEKNLARGRPVLSGLQRFQAYSDLIFLDDNRVVEANRFFREMHRDHPDAYFIFNDRPVDAWVASRLRHEGNAYGSFVGRYMSVTGLSQDGVTELWRSQYREHKAEVLEYFSGRDRFLHFDITTDGPDQIVAFLSRDFQLDPASWQWLGSSVQRFEKQKMRGEAS